jgi:hypothetical protein
MTNGHTNNKELRITEKIEEKLTRKAPLEGGILGESRKTLPLQKGEGRVGVSGGRVGRGIIRRAKTFFMKALTYTDYFAQKAL